MFFAFFTPQRTSFPLELLRSFRKKLDSTVFIYFTVVLNHAKCKSHVFLLFFKSFFLSQCVDGVVKILRREAFLFLK